MLYFFIINESPEIESLILMLGISIIDVVYLQNERDNENDENRGLYMY